MLNFEITEDTAVGSVVYTLQGIDPEGANVLYTISGDHFSVNRNTGVITLRAPLDREVEDLLDVVVTIQDENFPDQIGKPYLNVIIKRNIFQKNCFVFTVPFRRQIRVVDVNDNAPTFVKSVYEFDVDETVEVGQTLFTQIGLSDADFGANAVVNLRCDVEASPEACDTFDLRAQEQSPGKNLFVRLLLQLLIDI